MKERPWRRLGSIKKVLSCRRLWSLPFASTGADSDRVISEGQFQWVSQGPQPGATGVSLLAALLPVQLPPDILQQSGLRCAGGPETRSAQSPDHFGY